MLLPGQGYPLTFGFEFEPLADVDVGLGGFIHGSGPFSKCNSRAFFGQTKDVVLTHAFGLSETGNKTRLDPSVDVKEYMNQSINRIVSLLYTGSLDCFPNGDIGGVFKDVMNPVLTPGDAKMIDRETGGYQKYGGMNPSEFSFTLPGVRPLDLYNMSRYMGQIRPMSYGIFLVNQSGDLLGVRVLIGKGSDPYDPDNYHYSALLPIPILGLRRQAVEFGGFDNPDTLQITATLPPNFECPYPEYTMFTQVTVPSFANYAGWVRFSGLVVIPFREIQLRWEDL